jgi:hypothetical protein
MDGACSTHGVMRNTYKSLIGKLEGKRQLVAVSAQVARLVDDNCRDA